MILGADGEKMSKSRGNVVNPDDIVSASGADALRLYEMFMGPLDAVKPWQTSQVAGVVRFRDKVYALTNKCQSLIMTSETESLMHKTMRKVTKDIENLSFNTAISAMMILANHLASLENNIPKEPVQNLIIMLSPFAPHLAEECYAILTTSSEKNSSEEKKSIAYVPWVTWDDDKCQDATVTVAIQVNGKVRAKLQLDPNEKDQAKVKDLALKEPAIAKFIDRDTTIIKKFIYVPGRIVNFVL